MCNLNRPSQSHYNDDINGFLCITKSRGYSKMDWPFLKFCECSSQNELLGKMLTCTMFLHLYTYFSFSLFLRNLFYLCRQIFKFIRSSL